MNKLIQRKLFLKREFELSDKGLKYKVRNLSSYFEVEIPYEEIGIKRIDQKATNNTLLIFSCFLFIVLISKIYFLATEQHNDYTVTLVILFGFLFVLLLTYLGYKDIVLIEAQNPSFIEFFANRPSKEVVEKFISELKSRTKGYLINKYAERDSKISIENQLHKINWLKDRNVIDEKEYEELTNKLIKPDIKSIGFKK
ncbi:MAG: hypothetical protein ABIT08_08800 [Bacteroidia bacterium]